MSDAARTLSRRTVLAGAAALAGSLPWPRAMAAPYRIQHGAFEIMVVSDGHLVLPTSFLAPQAPEAERVEILKQSGETGAQYNSPTNVTLIRAGADLILIDAGSGPNFMPTAGKLADNLDAAGIARDKITKVVFTHAHPDHIWGATDDLDELQFPNASYLISAAEWTFWTGEDARRSLPEERQGFVTGARRNLARLKDKLTIVKGGDDIAPGLRVLDTPGHTQGHVSIEVAGDGGLVIVGDALTHALISFAHPDWRTNSDHEPDRAVATRKRLLDRLAADKTRVISYHLPYPGTGYVERKDGAYRFVPA